MDEQVLLFSKENEDVAETYTVFGGTRIIFRANIAISD